MRPYIHRISKYIFIVLIFLSSVKAQTFELGSGLFFYNVTGNVLTADYSGNGTFIKKEITNKTYQPMGFCINYYHPFLYKSAEASVGIFTGLAGFIRWKVPPEPDSRLYQYNQLGTTSSNTKGFQIPLLLNCRLGRNATKYSNAKVGLAFGGGITMSAFSYGDYYFDKFIYFPPTVNCDLVLGRTTFRMLYFITPYKTYYVYDTGQKESKYDFSQFSITANITLGDN